MHLKSTTYWRVNENRRDRLGHNAAYWANEFGHLDCLKVFTDIDVQPVSLSSKEQMAYGMKCRELLGLGELKISKPKKKGAGKKGGKKKKKWALNLPKIPFEWKNMFSHDCFYRLINSYTLRAVNTSQINTW